MKLRMRGTKLEATPTSYCEISYHRLQQHHILELQKW